MSDLFLFFFKLLTISSFQQFFRKNFVENTWNVSQSFSERGERENLCQLGRCQLQFVNCTSVWKKGQRRTLTSIVAAF